MLRMLDIRYTTDNFPESGRQANLFLGCERDCPPQSSAVAKMRAATGVAFWKKPLTVTL